MVPCGLHVVRFASGQSHAAEMTETVVAVVGSEGSNAPAGSLRRRAILHVARCYPRRDLRRIACLGAEGSTPE